ncbi:hypothetical protein GCM10009533_60350 [Saccharopolyspora spinosporotrichia]|uniref:Uncharacterized protein n=1 Tax=Saccharopolyspora erythraea TaxID=1836 RepID=A0ABN1DXM0_SACER
MTLRAASSSTPGVSIRASNPNRIRDRRRAGSLACWSAGLSTGRFSICAVSFVGSGGSAGCVGPLGCVGSVRLIARPPTLVP